MISFRKCLVGRTGKCVMPKPEIHIPRKKEDGNTIYNVIKFIRETHEGKRTY